MIELRLNGQCALITGASGELGRVMARTLAAAGASLVLHYHKARDRAESLAAELRARGTVVRVIGFDVTDASATFHAQQTLAEQGVLVDIVVCNAVIQYQWRPVIEQPLDDFDSQYRSCVMQLVHLAKAFGPEFLARGRGRMIVINTECAMQCFETQAAYAAAKRGMDGVVRVLAREWGPNGVTVNQVAPGWTISERERVAGPAAGAEDYTQRVPLQRRGTDQDVANAVLFFASELADYITGAYLPVCGGNVLPGI